MLIVACQGGKDLIMRRRELGGGWLELSAPSFSLLNGRVVKGEKRGKIENQEG